MRNVVVIGWGAQGMFFWNGTEWVDAFRDAELYTEREALALVETFRANEQDVDATRDYGLDSERTITAGPGKPVRPVK